MNRKKIKPITKARKLESTKKGLSFYVTPSSFRLSYPAKITAGKPARQTAGKFRVFVIRGCFQLCHFPLFNFRHFRHFSAL